MSITAEELRQSVMSTTLVPMVDESNPHVFGLMMRFPTGKDGIWHLTAPDHPIDDAWIKQATQQLLEHIIRDLREGREGFKRDRQAFRCTNWESVTGALNCLLVEWEKTRRDWMRALEAPKVIQ
jgi:hypothetical protein